MPPSPGPNLGAAASWTASSCVGGDALGGSPRSKGPFDLLFVDASKGEYARYIELAEPGAHRRALLVIDNLLM